MKKLLFALIFVSLPAFGQERFEHRITDLSSGLVTFPPANRIPDNAASFIWNFYTDEGDLATERRGFIKKEPTVIGGTKAVTALWKFTDTEAREWLVAFYSRTFWRSQSGENFEPFGLTATSDFIPTAAVSLGRIWFTNRTDDVWWFDGASTGTVSSAPKGRIIFPWRNRIAIADYPGFR
jgi:hypothetical protein